MEFSKIPIGRNPPSEVNVVIEIPMGGNPVKYEFDKESGAMYVDRFLHTAMIIPSRPVGVLLMEDESGVDEKLLCVPLDDLHPYYGNIKTVTDVRPVLLDQISHFFEHYKDLEADKWVKVQGWDDHEKAFQLIIEAIERASRKEGA